MMFSAMSHDSNDAIASRLCTRCGKEGRPLLRIVGYPTAEAHEMVARGEAVLKGCLIDEVDDADYECPHCGASVDVPEEA